MRALPSGLDKERSLPEALLMDQGHQPAKRGVLDPKGNAGKRLPTKQLPGIWGEAFIHRGVPLPRLAAKCCKERLKGRSTLRSGNTLAQGWVPGLWCLSCPSAVGQLATQGVAGTVVALKDESTLIAGTYKHMT